MILNDLSTVNRQDRSRSRGRRPSLFWCHFKGLKLEIWFDSNLGHTIYSIRFSFLLYFGCGDSFTGPMLARLYVLCWSEKKQCLTSKTNHNFTKHCPHGVFFQVQVQEWSHVPPSCSIFVDITVHLCFHCCILMFSNFTQGMVFWAGCSHLKEKTGIPLKTSHGIVTKITSENVHKLYSAKYRKVPEFRMLLRSIWAQVNTAKTFFFVCFMRNNYKTKTPSFRSWCF